MGPQGDIQVSGLSEAAAPKSGSREGRVQVWV